MTFKIDGFLGTQTEQAEPIPSAPAVETTVPRKSVVQVKFPEHGAGLAYFNDSFDLKVGDRVYVDGKMAGKLGCVTAVNYNFKIKRSEIQKVIACCDTNVSGQFLFTDSHFVTFDPAVLSVEQVRLWFRGPEGEDEEYVCGTDDTSFSLDDPRGMNVSPAIAQRGHHYYLENRVRFINLHGTHGFAIVEGTENYIVEFEYHNGRISQLFCDCYCTYNCKHEVAVLLQLADILDWIEEYHQDKYLRTGYFSAVDKATMFRFAVEGKEQGSFDLNLAFSN